MKNILFITHCSAKKNRLENVTPNKLYTATYLQRFVKRCEEKNVKWAILSDKYGIVFSDQKISYYELPPSKVMKNEERVNELEEKITSQLKSFDIVFFYHNPGRFHTLYKFLVNHLRRSGIKIQLITHLDEITTKF